MHHDYLTLRCTFALHYYKDPQVRRLESAEKVKLEKLQRQCMGPMYGLWLTSRVIDQARRVEHTGLKIQLSVEGVLWTIEGFHGLIS